jgi:hypothetical protein
MITLLDTVVYLLAVLAATIIVSSFVGLGAALLFLILKAVV